MNPKSESLKTHVSIAFSLEKYIKTFSVCGPTVFGGPNFFRVKKKWAFFKLFVEKKSFRKIVSKHDLSSRLHLNIISEAFAFKRYRVNTHYVCLNWQFCDGCRPNGIWPRTCPAIFGNLGAMCRGVRFTSRVV